MQQAQVLFVRVPQQAVRLEATVACARSTQKQQWQAGRAVEATQP